VGGPDIIAPPPVLYAGPWIGGLLLDRLLPLPRLPPGLRLVGLPLTAAGIALGGWFFATMRRAATPIDPREAPTALVTEGPFRRTRNPAYVGLTLTYAGLSVLTGGRWSLLLLPGVLVAVDQGSSSVRSAIWRSSSAPNTVRTGSGSDAGFSP